MNNTYIFGFDQLKEPFIGCFNPDSMKLSKLPIPQGLQIHNHMSVAYVGINQILLSGGVTKTKKISCDVTMYHPLTNKITQLPDLLLPRYAHVTLVVNSNASGNSSTSTPNFNTVYFIGGRTYGCDFTSLTNNVQSLTLKPNQFTQQKCAPMIKRRCTFSAFLYGGEIYALGGYSGGKRTKLIQKYSPQQNIWRKADFQLPRGVQGILLWSIRPDEVILIGGNLDDGDTASTHLINLAQQTIRFLPDMNVKRIMHKGCGNSQQLYVFGGDDLGTIEKAVYDPCWAWSTVDPSSIDTTKFVDIKLDLTLEAETNYSIKTVIVQKTQPLQKQNIPSIVSSATIPTSTLSNVTLSTLVPNSIEQLNNESQNPNSSLVPSVVQTNKSINNSMEPILMENIGNNLEIINSTEETHCIFGTDDYPFIMLINSNQQKVSIIAGPVNLALKCFMSGVRITDKQNKIFISGGITSGLSKISRHCYIYDMETNTASRVANLHYHRYAHQSVYLAPYVYILGGRGYQTDGLSLYQSNERYNTQTGQIEVIGSFSEAQCSFSSLVINGEIYTIGGYLGEGKRTKKIEKYREAFDEWQILNVQMPQYIQAANMIAYSNDSFLVFGGKGNDKDFDSVLEFQIRQSFENEKVDLPEKEIAQMKCQRCLEKCLQVSPFSFIVFGGNADKTAENFVQLVQIDKEVDNESYSDLCSKLSKSFQFMNIAGQVNSMLFA